MGTQQPEAPGAWRGGLREEPQGLACREPPLRLRAARILQRDDRNRYDSDSFTADGCCCRLSFFIDHLGGEVSALTHASGLHVLDRLAAHRLKTTAPEGSVQLEPPQEGDTQRSRAGTATIIKETRFLDMHEKRKLKGTALAGTPAAQTPPGHGTPLGHGTPRRAGCAQGQPFRWRFKAPIY